MYMMVIVINKPETLNEILESFLKIGITGATVVDSKGMGRTFLDCESPVVGGLRSLIFNQCRSSNNTIISVIDSLEIFDQATAEIEKITGKLGDPGTGIACVFPLARVKGFNHNSYNNI